jgi:hypothetical protein
MYFRYRRSRAFLYLLWRGVFYYWNVLSRKGRDPIELFSDNLRDRVICTLPEIANEVHRSGDLNHVMLYRSLGFSS